MDKETYKKTAMRVSIVTIIINLILSILKLVVGIIISSSALISDSLHSASDVFSTLIVMFGIVLSSKDSDEQHQYGHERIESIVSLILAGILFIVGFGIGYEGIIKIFSGGYFSFTAPGIYGIITAIISIVVKEYMYRYTKKAAIQTNSNSLMADAWHHRSDSFSSIGSLVGIIGTQLGYPIFDSIASVIICIFIIKVSFNIFLDGCKGLIDKSCDEETTEKIRKIVSQQEGVLRIDMIKTRLFGTKIYIDIEISADSSQTLAQAHNIAENIHNAIENDMEQVKHCMVHVNPF